MNLEQITLKGATADPASGARPLALAAGKDLVARVVSAPLAGGRGLISLAGVILEARVPAGLASGQVLQLRVTRADAQELVVRIVHDAAEHPDQQASTRLAGELAAARRRRPPAGRPRPGRRPAVAAGRRRGDDHDRAGGRGRERLGPAAAEARRPSRCTAPSWARSRCGCGWAPEACRAGVVAPAGRVADLAETALPDLVAALERATGRPAAAAVQRRPDSAPAPAPPGGAFDGYA